MQKFNSKAKIILTGEHAVVYGFSAVATQEEITANNFSLGIPKYVAGVTEESEEEMNLDEIVTNWLCSSNRMQNEYSNLNELIGGDQNA